MLCLGVRNKEGVPSNKEGGGGGEQAQDVVVSGVGRTMAALGRGGGGLPSFGPSATGVASGSPPAGIEVEVGSRLGGGGSWRERNSGSRVEEVRMGRTLKGLKVKVGERGERGWP